MLTTRTIPAVLAYLAIASSAAVRLAAFECDGIEPVPGEAITLELVRNDINRPVEATAPPGDTERLFVVDQSGRIRIIHLADNSLETLPFLDIRDRVRDNQEGGNEMGLLGLAFHPDFAQNGYFYVNYNRNAGAVCAGSPPPGCTGSRNAETVVARYQVSADPSIADRDSEKILLAFCQPFSNHNGGKLAFGPNDGYLYISTGDGGAGDDPCSSGQNLNSFLGKILRLDVDVENDATPYEIPPDNPFVGVNGFDEIWALGLRNPWRFSFDPGSDASDPARGDLYIGDVGQGAREEIDYQPAGRAGGTNFQWRRMEGLIVRPGDGGTAYATPTSSLASPIFDYAHSGASITGCSVTGGVVYRGCRMPDLHGTYFFADYCSNWVRTFRVAGGQMTDLRDRTTHLNSGAFFSNTSAFGTDGRGEVYILNVNGNSVYRIVPDFPPTARIDTTPSPAVVALAGGSASITLDGRGSDNGGNGTQRITYSWAKVSGPDGDSIVRRTLSFTDVNFTQAGEYRYRLTVAEPQASDAVEVAVTVIGGPPTARIASNPNPPVATLADGSAEVTLDGGGSDDGDGGSQGLTFLWEKVSGPAGDAIAAPDQPATKITFTAAGIFGYRLTVNDGAESDTAEIEVTVDQPALPEFRRGDANFDQIIDISDAVAALGYLFLGDPPAVPCKDALDSNDDGLLDISDPVSVLTSLFETGEALPPPSPGCGPDPTEDPIDCEASTCL